MWTEYRLTGLIITRQCLAGVAVQICGIERIAPTYYLFSMASGGPASSIGDQIMPLEVAEAVLPATLLGYVLPATLISLVPLTATGVSQSDFNIQTSVVYAFYLAPITVPVLTTVLSRLMQYVRRSAESSRRGAKAAPEARQSPQTRKSSDVLRSLRAAYAVSFAIQAAEHLYTIARGVIQAPGGQVSLASAVGSLLTYSAVPGQRYSSLSLHAGATLGFGLYTVWYLRRRGLVTNTETRRSAIGVLAGQVLFGPGATYAGLWWWREGVLAKSSNLGTRTI